MVTTRSRGPAPEASHGLPQLLTAITLGHAEDLEVRLVLEAGFHGAQKLTPQLLVEQQAMGQVAGEDDQEQGVDDAR